MKLWISALAAVLAIGMVGASDVHAAKADKKAKKGGGETAGTIEKIEGKAPNLTITVSGGKKGGSKTVTTDAKTSVTQGGQAKKLKDLHVGSKVKLDAAGGTVKSIELGGAGKKADAGKAKGDKAAKKAKKAK